MFQNLRCDFVKTLHHSGLSTTLQSRFGSPQPLDFMQLKQSLKEKLQTVDNIKENMIRQVMVISNEDLDSCEKGILGKVCEVTKSVL